MSPRKYFVVSIILLLFISSTVYSKEMFSKDIKLEIQNKDIKLENKTDVDIKDKYQNDIYYPPEEYLAKQGMTLETYKQSLVDNAPKNRGSSVSNIHGTSPLTGNIHIPVLLVQFTDKMHTLSLSDINAAFNSPNYLNGQGISVSKYYTKQSYGDLNITFDVYNWMTAPHTYSYYSQNYNYNFEMMLDVINMYNPYIDYSQYDSDGDGRIDGLVIIYPGQIGSAPNGIWPHARILRNYNGNPVDGKYLGNIAAVPEQGYYGGQFEIHIATHEFAHVLGLMDLYALGPNGSGDGPLKGLTMMDYQFHPNCLNKPINLDAWSRYFFGWTDPIVLTTDSPKEISLRSANDYPDAVILRNDNMTPREFFIIENRYRNANDPNNLDNCMFNVGTYLHGGFAIYHVDENKIEAHYPNNWVNWDPDGNWFDDTVSHPGIMYEQNRVFSFVEFPNPSDFYYNGVVNGCNYAYFDENTHMCQTMVYDSTTRAYSGVENPLIRFEALSPSQQPTMTAKMLVGEETSKPQSSPSPGMYSQSTQVTLSTSTPNSIIYYTTDGSTPTQDSQVYTTPITIPESTTLTIKAIAKKDGYYVSDVMSSTYTITGTVATPTSSHPSGIVDCGSQVTLSTSTNGASIRYTLDGSNPTESSLLYSTPITITSSLTLKAKAFKYGFLPSEISTYNYQVLVVQSPVSSLESGSYEYGTTLELSIPTENAEIRYTVDGSEPTVTSQLYTLPLTITSNFTLKVKGFKQGYAPSSTTTYNYQVLEVQAPVSSLVSGIYEYGTTFELSTLTENAEIRYTVDGSEPTITSQLYTEPLIIINNFTLKAKGFKQNYMPSLTSTYNYTSSPAPNNYILSFSFYGIDSHAEINNDQNTVVVSVPAGTSTYNLTPIIEIENHCTISPDINEPQNFNLPVTYVVSSLSGQRVYTVSVVKLPYVLPPVASISGGEYDEPITVELTTSTPDTIIKYTTDGTFPTLRSTTYTGPITISSTTTLKAKAYLYTGPTVSESVSRLSKRNTTNPKTTADITPTTVTWQSSDMLVEDYIFTQKYKKVKVKKEKPVIIKKEKLEKKKLDNLKKSYR